ncbi:MAG: hypothetical protein Q4B58_04600 [Bacteroidales bacterium]|nr:hypothetical protein [Bacteroidales bacterium]
MNKICNTSLLLGALFAVANAQAQDQNWQVPVLETDEPMETGKFEPNWESLSQ